MNLASTPTPFPTHADPSGAIRWDGHMADDVGSTYGPDPLAFLSVTGGEILLCGNRGSFRLPRAALRGVGRGGFYPWFFCAVRLHHTVAGYPAELQFKPLGAAPREVLEQLRAFGYPAV